MSRIHRLLLAAALSGASLLIGSVLSAHAQNIVPDPGFESDSNIAWNGFGDAGILPWGGYGITGTVPAEFGDYFEVFNSSDSEPNAVIYNTFATTPGTLYDVSFVFGNLNISGAETTQALRVDLVNADTSVVDKTYTATSIAPAGQADFATVMGTTYSFSFTATGTQTTLNFTDISPDTASTDGLLDNVNMSAAQVAVPEANTGLLALLAGVPTVGFITRRKRGTA